MTTRRICSIADCDQPAHSRGWCAVHYGRWYRNGDPEAATPERKPYKRRTATPPAERHKKVRALVAAGHTNRQIAEMLDVNESTVLRDRKHLGIMQSQITPPTTESDLLERRQTIRDLLDAGLTNKQIATRLGISTRTVSADRKAMGLAGNLRISDTHCKIDTCSNIRRGGASGWCSAHYNRWRIHGDPQAHIPIRQIRGTEPGLIKTGSCARCGISFRRARPAAPHPEWCWDCWDVDHEIAS